VLAGGEVGIDDVADEVGDFAFRFGHDLQDIDSKT
jgi:hypothetical protein